MPSNVVINWSQPVDIDGAHYPKDTLNRAKYAQYLSNFLASKGYDESREGEDKKRNYVLNLNSEWGSGKTYFLKRWAEDLKAHHPVVYVDAWQQDYSDDPLMTVISSMVSQLREQAGRAEGNAAISVIGKAGGLFKALAPAVVGGVTKKFTGIDFAAVMNDAEGASAESGIKDEDGNALDMSAAASKAVQYMLDEHEGKAKAISALKQSVTQWLEAVKGLTDKQYPAFVFIDELDRCRPSYAVEMLETIKHIFDIKGVVFVVATDTRQLQHAVRVVYGQGFDADIYLGRFFNTRYTLKKMPLKELLSVHCDLDKLSINGLSQKGIRLWPRPMDTDVHFENLSTIYRALKLSERESIQITERLVSIVDNLDSAARLDIYYLAVLMCLKEKHFKLYDQLQHVPMMSKNLEYQGSPMERFDQLLNWDGIMVKLAVEAGEYTYSALSDVHPTYLNFNDSVYDIEIRSLFERVHTHHFDAEHARVVCDSAIESIRATAAEMSTPIRDFGILKMAFNKHQGNIISLGLKYEGVKSRYSFYKDLVELSTALDF
ncbi:KAP family P-loop NTPase fold protein [Vibrio vulnificus]|uniref:KAP family P-loop NTPase fold protein n=1 Tax=Vibrio vulnificus TaxID=672 RepID=UPI001A2EE2EB|nr:P-loop NTPase fold protein [Vibrio vulnificus]ELV8589152.1 NTPase KAP [Vibrio vulnificus]MCA3980397.1 NTPase KAP [Vibrio vulnificus]MCR9498583.1 KAP family NTPase [Vibrio vulnificus]MCU8389987.1 KAP family NTPase [Vibrio vulnificus]MCU8546580.1 KAP family NTPase [Vibrio vulnificus]